MFKQITSKKLIAAVGPFVWRQQLFHFIANSCRFPILFFETGIESLGGILHPRTIISYKGFRQHIRSPCFVPLRKTGTLTIHDIILVNEQDEQVGTMEKMEAHRKALLHRAFSVFIFNSRGEMLLQQRALKKYHSAGLWTNACCSHPKPGEDTLSAAETRLQHEMGFSAELKKIFEFTYRSVFDNGLTEYEFDHVFAGTYEGTIVPDKSEVNDYCYKSIDAIKESLQSHPGKYTTWFAIAFPLIEKWILEQAIIKEVA